MQAAGSRKNWERLSLAEGAGEAVGILKLGELNRHALVVVAHHAAAQTAENHDGIQRRLDPGGDRSAAQGDVDHPAVVDVAVRQDELLRGNARLEALMLPLLRSREGRD